MTPNTCNQALQIRVLSCICLESHLVRHHGLAKGSDDRGMEEWGEDLKRALDDIDAYGERFR